MNDQKFLEQAKKINARAYKVSREFIREVWNEVSYSCTWIFMPDMTYVHAVVYKGKTSQSDALALDLLKKLGEGEHDATDAWQHPDGTVTRDYRVAGKWGACLDQAQVVQQTQNGG